VRGLARRFRPGSADGLAVEWELRIGHQVFTVGVAEMTCVVREGACRSPAVSLAADPATWLAMDEGRITGIDAFLQRRLQVRGSVDLAVRTLTMFRQHGRPRRGTELQQVEFSGNGIELSCYVAGGGRPLILLHGLGGSKLSWLPLLHSLAEKHRVIVPDLPGHGESAKPAADYTPRFYARTVRRLMDLANTPRALIVGNSMGGRVALELALGWPARVERLVLLGPALPGLRWRSLISLSGMIPAQFGTLPFPVRERWMRSVVRRMFAHPERLAPETLALAAQEFVRIYREPRARMAFFSSLRHLVTEAADPFWASTARIRVPALVVVGLGDRIVPPGLGARLARQLPNATLHAMPEVGHVPQFEAPDRTMEAIRVFIDGGSAVRP
jgi:pimeloyl-ACP methyl ester carboxylesterase